MSETVVGLVQINNSFSGQNYLPLSVGVLQVYAQKYLERPDRFQFLLPVYTRVSVEQAVNRLKDADVVLFSTYVWNIRISLEVARTLKRLKPEVIVAFGGPQVPERPREDEVFLRAHPFIDVACHGEGEQPVVKILERSGTDDWQSVPSTSFISKKGSYVQNPKGSRLNDLAAAPSPYLGGAFALLMEAHPEERWIGLWETNRGCPFSCTFCDWGSATQSKVYKFDLERLLREVDWFAEHRIEYVFCCDANFGILPRDIDIARYVSGTKEREGYPHALSVQNTKNATERAYQVQKILSDAGLNKGVDIALQSVDPKTLESIKRGNISTETYQELQRRFTRDGIETYTDVILGLPGESYGSFVEGVSRIIENGQHNRIQFNNLSILPNAEMGDPEYQKKYGLVTVETQVVNIHGSLDASEDEIFETQELVVATRDMPQEDWARARAFSWMAALLHFDKVLQIPIVLIHNICSVRPRELIERFLDDRLADASVLASVRHFFLEKARDIQKGGAEYCQSRAWLGIWWPADEYILIKLSREKQLDAFYREAERLLGSFLEEHHLGLPSAILKEAVQLNRELIKQPFHTTDLHLDLSYNIWEFYQASLRGGALALMERPNRCVINRTEKQWSTWNDWCREVIWWGNKKGAYMYGNNIVEPQLAGHY
ncbi:MAG: radical SAM protein [Candidatus Omnitrophica bacterium]|nr:radical SAM protein [Candidatus Omnitrophota bacterium]